MNAQKIYDNISKVFRKHVVKYIVVVKLAVEFNMGTYNFEDRSRLKVWRRSMKHINVQHKAVETDTKNNIRYIAQTQAINTKSVYSTSTIYLNLKKY